LGDNGPEYLKNKFVSTQQHRSILKAYIFRPKGHRQKQNTFYSNRMSFYIALKSAEKLIFPGEKVSKDWFNITIYR